MFSYRSTAVLVALVLSGGVTAWGATSEDAFLGVLKKFGISTLGSAASKKPCLCRGGPQDGAVGVVELQKKIGGPQIGEYGFDCDVYRFNSDGSNGGFAECLGTGGK